MSRMDLRIDPTRDEPRDGCGGMAAEGNGGGGGSADGISRRFARPARLGLACVTARVHEVTEVTDGESRAGQRRGTPGPELRRCGQRDLTRKLRMATESEAPKLAGLLRSAYNERQGASERCRNRSRMRRRTSLALVALARVALHISHFSIDSGVAVSQHCSCAATQQA
ncbi:hypothetical protein L1887_46120 [Cichorium endivia]|nr:hypothetical protein L1887_46120 [Cichorium endivia]